MSSLIVKQTCVCVFVCADQTPTPTRFLKNCEEVGLFSELAGSFEQDLRKTQEEEERRIKGTVKITNKERVKILKGYQLYALSDTVSLMNLISWTSKLPALQTPTEVKEREGPLEIDSSPPDSPDSPPAWQTAKMQL